MAKPSKREKAARGTGTGANYRPYRTVQNMKARSTKSRIPGWTTGRVHHLATQLHAQYFYLLDFAEAVVDIQEEYPLPIDDSLTIAKRLGVRHPMQKDEPRVITTAFRLTVAVDGANRIFMRSVASSRALSARHGLASFEIERVYYQALDLDWGIVTDEQFPTVLASNVEGIHGFRQAEGIVPLPQDQLEYVAGILTREVLAAADSLSSISNQVDQRLGLKPGCCIALARHLIANRRWRIDMTIPFAPTNHIALLATDPQLRS